MDTTYWAWILLIGLVVILAVVALLSLLVYFVKVIEKRVVEVKQTLVETSKNTESAALIPQVGDGVDLVLAEGLQHHLFLGRVATATGTAPLAAGDES
ncbi:MAG TPA: hypothetical protein VGN81_29350 [Pseudonocardiaceae bacterium]